MAEDVPTTVLYGTLTGRVSAVLADSPDPGAFPEEENLNGTITATPLVTELRFPTETPKRLRILKPQTLEVLGGEIFPPGTKKTTGPRVPGVGLVASSQPDANPDFFQWRLEFDFDGVEKHLNPVPRVIEILPGVNDIADAVPQAPLPGTVTVVSEQTRVAAEAAAERAEAAADQAVAAVLPLREDPTDPGTYLILNPDAIEEDPLDAGTYLIGVSA